MKRVAAALALLAVVLFPAASSGAYPTPTKLSVSIFDSSHLEPQIRGTTDPSQLADLTISAPGGEIRAVDRTLSDATSGEFSFSLDLTQKLHPGDKVEIVLGDDPSWKYSMVYSKVSVAEFDLGAGTIRGAVTPRKPRILSFIYGRRVVPDAALVAKVANVRWIRTGAGIGTDAAGRFVLKPVLTGDGWSGGYRRCDVFMIGYSVFPVAGDRDFSFNVQNVGYVPGLFQSVVDSNDGFLAGVPGRTYAATLRSPTGIPKAATSVSFGLGEPIQYLGFVRPDGTPADIMAGDSIGVSGLGGFTARVPALRATIDTALNRVRVSGPPNARIEVDIYLYDDLGVEISPGPGTRWVKTNAAGRAVTAPGGGFVLRDGDRVIVRFLDALGHTWNGISQKLPAGP